MTSYILMTAGAFMLVMATAVFLMARDAKIKSKSRIYVQYAKYLLGKESDCSIKDFSLCNVKGISVAKSENGKYAIKPKYHFANFSFFS